MFVSSMRKGEFPESFSWELLVPMNTLAWNVGFYFHDSDGFMPDGWSGRAMNVVEPTPHCPVVRSKIVKRQILEKTPASQIGAFNLWVC